MPTLACGSLRPLSPHCFHSIASQPCCISTIREGGGRNLIRSSVTPLPGVGRGARVPTRWVDEGGCEPLQPFLAPITPPIGLTPRTAESRPQADPQARIT